MKRRALIVGINQYQRVSGLRGCVNDATALRLLLKEIAGFENRDICLLVDEQATKSAIEERLAWLVRNAEAGDLMLLHFSGHGTQIRDTDEQDELVDQLDEVICPWDMSWSGSFITDDYLRDNLQVKNGVVLEVILDCCHSGDGTDSTQPPRSNSASKPASAARALSPPADIRSRHEAVQLARRRVGTGLPGKPILWSACGAAQTAADADFDNVYFGAFTYYFCSHLRTCAGAVSRLDLLERVRASLRDAGYEQVPELSAAPDLVSAQPFRL